MTLRIVPDDPTHPDIVALIRDLDELQDGLYPPDSNHLEPPSVLAAPGWHFVAAWEDDAVLGCGAVGLKADDGRYGELKRIYVRPDQRGRGIGRDITLALERWVQSEGVHLLRLETGYLQPEAIRLYERLGFNRRGPFGNYTDDPNSVFMEKALASADSESTNS